VEVVVQLALLEELRVLAVGMLKLDGDFHVGLHVYALVDRPERPLIDFTQKLIVFAHPLHHL
jgi:hypothetical protein